MKNLSDEILNLIEDSDLSCKEVANKTGVSARSIYEIKKRGTIGFLTMLKIAQVCKGADYHESMRKWCRLLTTTEAIRHAFEYAAIKRDVSLLGDLLDSAEGDDTLSAYYGIYNLIYKFMRREIAFLDLHELLKEVRISRDKNLSIIVDIYKCYLLYYQKDFLGILQIANAIEKDIQNMGRDRSSFFKQCYIYRLAEVLMPVHLHFNNFEASRNFAKILLYSNISYKTMSDSYYCIGMTYLDTDKDNCLKNLERSYELMCQIERADLIEESQMHLELARLYYEVKQGASIKGVAGFAERMQLKSDSDFVKYFEFRLENSLSKLYEGYKYFFSRKNFLFANLIADDLACFGVDTAQVEALKSINLNEKVEFNFEEKVVNCFSHWSRISFDRVS
ncbi:AimR family lysis-lysogeny pheromone receptor [Bacillus spizizenii]|uniref:AimR family lysis-lysogeny pheromone receptor n=1 Tax=Bacillus spizizenii TaxID=96241 RepID=UPI003F74A85B